MGEQTAERRRHAAAVGAEAAELERLEQGFEALAVDRLGAGELLVRAAQPDPAGEALAAALVGAEAEKVAGDVAHLSPRVEGEDAAMPTMQPSAASASKSKRVSRREAGRMPP